MIAGTARSHAMTRAEILAMALQITEEYSAQGLDLTLRQLYYQFVGRGLIEGGGDEGKRNYKRIGDTLTDARYDGKFPIDAIVDRGRHVHHGAFTRNDWDVSRAFREASGLVRDLPGLLIQTDRWYGQDVHVSVWFEKEALAGVFAPVCDELGVGHFALKGYPSVSALHAWVEQTQVVLSHCESNPRYRLSGMSSTYSRRYQGTAVRCVVLYLGDHDPDGWEIPRSAERNIQKLRDLAPLRWAASQAKAYGWSSSDPGYQGEIEARASDYPDYLRDENEFGIEFKRLALNMDQIEEYNPPPFGAKEGSARYAGYVEEHETTDAWELDALEPAVLRDLIREGIADHFDELEHERQEGMAQDRRNDLIARMSDPNWNWRSP